MTRRGFIQKLLGLLGFASLLSAVLKTKTAPPPFTNEELKFIPGRNFHGWAELSNGTVYEYITNCEGFIVSKVLVKAITQRY